jgi:myosin heavy subunit
MDEQKELLEKIKKEMTSLIEDSMKGVANEKDINKQIEKLNKQIENLSDEGKKELKQRCDELAAANEKLNAEFSEATEALKAQGAEIKKMKEAAEKNSTPANTLTGRQAIRQAIKDAVIGKKEQLLNEVTDNVNGNRLSMLDYFREKGNKVAPPLTLKVAVDMLESNIVQSNVSALRLTELDAQRVGIPLTIYPHVMSVFQSKSISKPNMALLVVYSYEDGSGTKTEGSASSKSSFLLKTVSFPAFYIATYFTLSDETLDDLDEVLDEISATAPDKILDKIDTYILGSAGDDVTAIAGILTATKSTAYATALGAGAVDNAYIVDVIADAKLQCENAKYKPNVVYLNPNDIVKLGARKNSFEDSQSDRRVVYDAIGNPVAVCGLRIIISTAITADTCIVLDNSLPWIGKRKDMTMEIGYNGTDFVEGQKTVVIKVRIAFGVRDKAGVIYVNGIDAAAAALATP